MKFSYSALILVLLAVAAPLRAEPAYVSDQIEVMVRRGQATSFAILDRVHGGERVEVLARENGYAHIRTPKGIEGWVVGRYLMPDEPSQLRLKRARARVAELEAETAALQARMAELASTADTSAGKPPAPAVIPEPPAAAAAPAPVVNLDALQQQLANLEAAIEGIEVDDSGSSRRDFMLLGAGILVAGVLVGLLLPHLAQRGNADW